MCHKTDISNESPKAVSQQTIKLSTAKIADIKPDPTDSLDETAIHNIFVSVSKLRFGAHFCWVSSRPGKAVPWFATFDAHHTTPSVHKLTPTPTGTGSPRGAFWCILGGGNLLSLLLCPI